LTTEPTEAVLVSTSGAAPVISTTWEVEATVSAKFCVVVVATETVTSFALVVARPLAFTSTL
jgi:hypothetical protein